MNEKTLPAEAASADRSTAKVTSPGQPGGLRGNLGMLSLMFSVLAFNAPLGTVVGFMPVAIGIGNGAGSPILYLVGAMIMGLFSVGFLKMSPFIKNSGGFYSYITAGLGREVGLGASILALVGYLIELLGSIVFGGVSLNLLVTSFAPEINIAWWVYALASIVITGVLGYFRLDLSAKVLTFLLLAEVVIVLVYDAAIVASGGHSGLDAAAAFAPAHIFSDSLGVALLICVFAMGGFEATVVFREEVRNPERTIPRATYGFLACVGILYAFTSWSMIQGVGTDNAQAAFSADPAGAALQTFQTYLGTVGNDLVTVLLNTSILAASLSMQNISSRYIYNFSRDGLLPRGLGHVHTRHGSPHRASLTVSMLLTVGLAICVLAGGDPNFLYAQLVGQFGYAFFILLLLTTVAVVVFLRRHRPEGTNIWHRLIAPAIGLAGIVTVLYLATTNLNVLFTASPEVTYAIVGSMYVVVVIGIVAALILKRKRPEIYARIGRQ